MQLDDFKRIGARLLATTAVSAALIAAPVALIVDVESGAIAVKSAAALAKDGDDDSGSGSDNSGSGSGGDRDRDRDDDRSGSNSGSDRDDDDHDDDEDEDEDRSGRRGGDDRDDDRGAKVEIFGNAIEVTFADGTKEEIENGVYERKNAAGRTVEERPATQADIDRLAAIAGGAPAGRPAPGGSTGGVGANELEFRLSDGTKIEVFGDDIEVQYGDGWKEEIENGRYELKDPAGNTVVERLATDGDRTRLEAQLPG